jgi:hypothetical protein
MPATKQVVIIRNRPPAPLSTLTIAESLVRTTLASADAFPPGVVAVPLPPARARAVVHQPHNQLPLATADMPFAQLSWAVPGGKPYFIVKQGFVPGTNDVPEEEPEPEPPGDPFAQLQWPQPQRKRSAGLVVPPNLLHSTLAPTTTAPFTQTHWPVTRRVRRGGQGQIAYFVVDDTTPFVESQWPVPRRTIIPRALYSVTQSRPLSQEEPPKPFLLNEWPIPRPKGRPDIQSLERYRELMLTDTIDDTPQSVIDWPVPPKPLRSIELLTLSSNLMQSVLAPADRPFVPVTFPTPPAIVGSRSNLTFVDMRRFYFADEHPFVQSAWPLPVVLLKRVAETWTQNLVVTTLGIQQDPFTPNDRPNPRPRPVQTITWTLNLLQGTLTPEPDPFNQTEWPVFRATPPSIDLRTWLQARSIVLEDATPFKLDRWPIPAPRRVARGLGWIVLPQLGLFGSPATADVVIRVRGDVGIIRVRPDPDVLELL